MIKPKVESNLELDLELPDGRDFVSRSPVISFEEMCRINSEFAFYEMQKPDFWEQRKKRRPVSTEFIM